MQPGWRRWRVAEHTIDPESGDHLIPTGFEVNVARLHGDRFAYEQAHVSHHWRLRRETASIRVGLIELRHDELVALVIAAKSSESLDCAFYHIGSCSTPE